MKSYFSFLKDIAWAVENSLGHLFVLTIIGTFMVSFLIWANHYTIEKTVRAQGIVETTMTDKIVGHFEGGVVENIFVDEGDKVVKGQELLAVANTQITKERNKFIIKQKRLHAQFARLTAESANEEYEAQAGVNSHEEVSEAHIARYRKEALAEKINILETQIRQTEAAREASQGHIINLLAEQKLLQEQHDMLAPLVKKGIGSKQLLLQRKAELAKITTLISEVTNKLQEYALKIEEHLQRIEEERLMFNRDVREEKSQIDAELKMVMAELDAANERYVRSVIRSPVDGVVYRLTANTIGGVVRSGEALVEIVPKTATVRIEGKVQPQDRTKIWNGMEAKIRPSSYEFSNETILHATVVNISAKTFFDELTRTYYYKVIFKNTSEDMMKQKDFLPGMIVEINILSGEESVLDYILSPVARGVRGALSEHNTR